MITKQAFTTILVCNFFRKIHNLRPKYSLSVLHQLQSRQTSAISLSNLCVSQNRNFVVVSESRPIGLKSLCKTLLEGFYRNNQSIKMPPVQGQNPAQLVNNYISENKVMVFSKSFCPFCFKVKELFKHERIGFELLELDLIENGNEIQAALQEKSDQRTVPNVFINGQHIGGSDRITELFQKGELIPLLNPKTHQQEYDYIVLGGGSGGLASAKEAARLGAKVAVCDFVTPTPKGVTWGLGGTCVNVGCIPKKLMHRASLLGHYLEDAVHYGWKTGTNHLHNWAAMVEAIQGHVGSLNWGYKVALRDKKIDYLNVLASFIDPHTIKTVDKKGKEKVITGDKFLIAVGGRPRYPDIVGAKELCITSDDLFSLPYPPGKTLLVGASYISMECAGFLKGLGYDVTVMVRSILLRGFDQQMAEKLGEIMEKSGIRFIREAVPTSVEQLEAGTPGRLRVTAKSRDDTDVVDEYNTVIFAIGRDAYTKSLELEKAQVATAKSGKVIVDKYEKSSQSNIYAVGDVIEGGLELTPVAIQAGKLLARRLFGNGKTLTDYTNVPTTVFTPIEYGCCGYSEENALEKFGESNIEVYHSNFWPLENTVPHRPENDCYAKLIVHKRDGNEYVIGFHYVGPNAGEVTQGISLGLKMGATKQDFDDLIGIHPTCAEVFTTLTISKRSGKDVSAGGC